MTKTYELVQMAKTNTGINSDYGIAALIDVSKGMVSHWKIGRSEASGIPLLKLIKAAGLSVDDALELMTEKPLRKTGFATTEMMMAISGLSLVLVTPMAGKALEYCIPYIGTLYIMLNQNRQKN